MTAETATGRPGAAWPARFLHEHGTTVLAYVLALALFGVTSAFSSGFGSVGNIRALLLQASFIGVIALGQTFVVLTGGVDLSVPWVLNGAASLLTLWCNGRSADLWWAVPLLVVLGAAVGVVNGLGVTLFDVSPIVMTLGVNAVVQGAILVVFHGRQSPAAPAALVHFSKGRTLGVPDPVWLWAALIALAWFVLSRMAYGRKLYAVGTNARVAELSGLRTDRVRVLAYASSGAGSALAGILLAGYIGQSYFGMGNSYLFSSIAAVVIGGISVLGGTGHYVGAVAGALTLTVLAGLLPVLNLDPAALQVVYGLVILATVGLASLASRGNSG